MFIFSLILLLAIIFVALIIFLRNMLRNSLAGATANLEQMSSDYAKKEEEVRKQYEEARRQAQEIIASSQSDAETQKKNIIKSGQEESDRVVSEARDKAEQLIQQADNARKALIAEMEQKIEEKAVQAAVKLIKQVLPSHICQDIHERWFNDLSTSVFEKLERLHVPEEVTEARVVTAFSLSKAQQEAINDKIKEKLGRHITLTEEVDSNIIAGIIVYIGSIVFDGSLKFKIQEAAVVQ